MNANDSVDSAVSRIAAAIGETARTRILYCLLDGHARTSTELAIVAGVTPSTASVHLHRLRAENLVKVLVQGRHRYYSLESLKVARVLESLSVLAGAIHPRFIPNTPSRLRAARSCYDHMAGTLAVSLHDRFMTLNWIQINSTSHKNSYDLTLNGTKAFKLLGIDSNALQMLRRRFAYACLDWSERRPHLGGALGAALLKLALKKKWVTQDLDSRALTITNVGRREMRARFDLDV